MESVMLEFLWPARFDTVVIVTPSLSNAWIWVCRSPWNVTFGMPATLAASENLLVNAWGLRRQPSHVGSTSLFFRLLPRAADGYVASIAIASERFATDINLDPPEVYTALGNTTAPHTLALRFLSL